MANQCSTSVSDLLYLVSWYTWPCYNDTRLLHSTILNAWLFDSYSVFRWAVWNSKWWMEGLFWKMYLYSSGNYICIWGEIKSGFPQKHQKKVSWWFHDFSRPKSKFPDKNIPIFVFAAHVSNYRINYRQTQTHTHTDTHMIWSRPTNYSTDFTSNWTDSRSQNYTC